jgi:hypothetical protein
MLFSFISCYLGISNVIATETNLYLEDFNSGSNSWNLYNVTLENITTDTSMHDNFLHDNARISQHFLQYTNEYFNLSSAHPNPRDIYYHNGSWWVVDVSGHNVSRYDDDWIYTNDTYDVVGFPRSLHYQGGYWWVSTYSAVYSYYNNWTSTGTSFSFTAVPGDVVSLFFHNGNWYVLDNVNDLVYVYYDNWTYTGTTQSLPLASTKTSIRFQDSNWLVSDFGSDTVHLIYENWTATGSTYSISESSTPRSINFNGGYWYVLNDGNKVYKYSNLYDIPKLYQDNGYFYIQTNVTETLTARSPSTLGLALKSGDEITVTFNTTSTHRVDLSLLETGTERKSFNVSSEGNSNNSTRTVTYVIDDDVSADQLEFTGIFDTGHYFLVDSISITREVAGSPFLTGLYLSFLFIGIVVAIIAVVLVRKRSSRGK